MSIRILIADDHSVVRQGLRMFLSLDPDLQIVGEATNGVEAQALAESLRPDIVLMDLLMPRMNGIEATAAIRATLPNTKVIALTSALDNGLITGVLRAGAVGYLLKNTEADTLGRAIRSAVDGQVQLSPEAAALLLPEVKIPGSPETLTARETEVLRLVGEGRSNMEIATALTITEKTVKSHVTKILAKLSVNSRTQAALIAVQMGLAQLPDLPR